MIAHALVAVLAASSPAARPAFMTHAARIRLEPARALNEFTLVVPGGQFKGSRQGEHIIGTYAAWRDGQWRPVNWGGCGTGLEDATIGPGRYRASPIAPMNSPILGPGRYRFQVVVEAEDKTLHRAARVFDVSPAPPALISTLLNEMVQESNRDCAMSSDIAETYLKRATPAELARLFSVAGMPLHRRVQLIRQALRNEAFRPMAVAAVASKRDEVSLAASLALAAEGRTDMSPAVFERVATAVLTDEAGIVAIEALAELAPLWMPAWPRAIEPSLVDKLEATDDATTAFALALVLQRRERLSPSIRERAVNRVRALAERHAGKDGAALRALSQALSAGHEAFVSSAFLRRADGFQEDCPLALGMSAVLDQLGRQPAIVDVGGAGDGDG